MANVMSQARHGMAGWGGALIERKHDDAGEGKSECTQ